ncbi:MAG: aspartate--tRNA ligase [Patescibacteria group bacterium]|nr:aspartate--tRNA ligase [Patescibacteria group bacterium]
MRTYIKDLKDKMDGEVQISGWVNIRRDHGKLIFIDFRDRTGLVQMVVLPNHKEAHELAGQVRPEWVLEVKGKVNKRPDNMVKEDELNGDLEIEVLEINVLNEAKTPPFDVLTDGKEIGEENRLKYRYLDLRRPRLTNNIRTRGKIVKFLRDELEKLDFTEIETSILSKSSPEGARDFVVPSRVDNGKFYALPQAPQQYKQLLMMAGFERYFQVAKCFRDEDTRSDRQPEFTQIDMEMSFVKKEEVMALNEKLLIDLVEKHFPEKTIQEKPFPIISYKEATEKYGTDRPDLRKDKEDPNLLAFCWVVDFPFFEKVSDSDNPQAQGEWTFTHNPFSAPQDEWMDSLMDKKEIGNIIATQYDIALNGFEIGGGSIRNYKSDRLRKVLEIIGYSEDQIEKDFGYFIEAMDYGTPPHGGIAWGLDRLVTILLNESSIREVIPFAKTGEGRDLMMDSPAKIGGEQLKELGINISKKGK